MPGTRALRYLQIGKETTPGTIVPASTIWRGTALLTPEAPVVFPGEDVGLFGGGDRGYIPKIGATVAMDSTPLTYEQVLYILNGGIKSVTSGVADAGAGATGKIYAFPASTTSANTIKTFTMEIGDDQQGEVMEYAFVESFKLSGKAGEAWMMSANWRGRQPANQAKTGSLSVPSVEEALFQNTTLAIDAVSGTLGTTLVSSTLIAADIEVKTGLVARWTADGNKYFNTVVPGILDISAQLTFLYNASAVTERTNWRNGTSRQIRLKNTGSALATPGTVYSTKTFLIDLAGKWAKFDKLGEDNGNDIIQATFQARYNATAALYGSFTSVCDGLATLT